MKNIVILGAGGMGTLFGARLITGGQSNVYLVNNWPEYVENVNKYGIGFKDSHGTQFIPANAFMNALDLSKVMDGYADLIILFVKGFANKEVVESAKCITGPNTYYLTLQNGLGNPESIAETGVVAADHIFFGKTTEGGTMMEPGTIFHKGEGTNSATSIMPFEGPVSDELKYIEKMFCDCGINTEINDNVKLAIWEKVMMNCIGNSMAALLRMSTKAMFEDEKGEQIARLIAGEVLAVANASGIAFTEDTENKVLDTLRDLDLQASTGKDVLECKRTEIDTLNGAISKKGKELGIPTPANDLIYGLVSILQNNYDKTWDLGHAPAVCLH